jgi:hypothetical protein
VVKAADRHPGQEGYSLNPPREVGDEDPVYEQIQAKKVKARLRMLEQAQRVSGNVSQTCRFFGGPGRSSISGRNAIFIAAQVLARVDRRDCVSYGLHPSSFVIESSRTAGYEI